MEITEKMLLDNYYGICGALIPSSIINGEKVYFQFRKFDGFEQEVINGNDADVIDLLFTRRGRIEVDDKCYNHPSIEKIISDYNKIVGDETE